MLNVPAPIFRASLYPPSVKRCGLVIARGGVPLASRAMSPPPHARAASPRRTTPASQAHSTHARPPSPPIGRTTASIWRLIHSPTAKMRFERPMLHIPPVSFRDAAGSFALSYALDSAFSAVARRRGSLVRRFLHDPRSTLHCLCALARPRSALPTTAAAFPSAVDSRIVRVSRAARARCRTRRPVGGQVVRVDNASGQLYNSQ